MLNNKAEGAAAAQGPSGHWLVSGEQLICAFLCAIFISLSVQFFLFCFVVHFLFLCKALGKWAGWHVWMPKAIKSYHPSAAAYVLLNPAATASCFTQFARTWDRVKGQL